MSSDHAATIALTGPLAAIGRTTLAVVSYLGGIALLSISAAKAVVRPSRQASGLLGAMAGQWAWLLGAGIPLVGLVHASIGSFLAMQAYYGATFAEATGPVVGVGMFRNLAPLLSGFVMAGLLAGRLTPELRRSSLLGLDDDPTWRPDREVARGIRPDPRTPPEPARLVAVRLLAAAAAGPILAFWGGTLGTLVGLLVAKSMIGLPAPIFLGKMLEMLWARDVVGLVFKGAAFGFLAALFACFEGLRRHLDDGPEAVANAAFRAACLSLIAILVVNMAWFLLFYQAGPAFGPTVLTPPTP